MRAYEIAAGSSSLEGLRRCERPDPTPLPHQILVRLKAASLNYRDLLGFDEAPAAYRHLESGADFGKVVIRW
jgi:NADPH:quinone reductase-like Zn-dependent oxidoreductase